jgi:hypothetical protein
VNGTGGYGGTYGSSQVYSNAGILQTNPYGSPANSFLATIAGSAVGAVTGSIVQTAATQIDQWVRGVVSGQTAPLPGYQQIYQAQTTSGIIQVDSQGQPITGQSTAFVQNSDGDLIIGGEIQTIETASGTFNRTNLTQNLKYATVTTDESGKSVTEYVYRDGTTVIYNDEKGVVEQIYPGANYVFGTNTINAPVNARDQIIAGQTPNPGQQQTYTDPRTGMTFEIAIYPGNRMVRYEVSAAWGVKNIKPEHTEMEAPLMREGLRKYP